MSVDPTSERRRLLAIKAIDDKLAELSRIQPNDKTKMISKSNDLSSSSNDISTFDVNTLDSNLPSDADLARLEQEVTQTREGQTNHIHNHNQTNENVV
jgi:hypothetical protein